MIHEIKLDETGKIVLYGLPNEGILTHIRNSFPWGIFTMTETVTAVHVNVNRMNLREFVSQICTIIIPATVSVYETSMKRKLTNTFDFIPMVFSKVARHDRASSTPLVLNNTNTDKVTTNSNTTNTTSTSTITVVPIHTNVESGNNITEPSGPIVLPDPLGFSEYTVPPPNQNELSISDDLGEFLMGIDNKLSKDNLKNPGSLDLYIQSRSYIEASAKRTDFINALGNRTDMESKLLRYQLLNPEKGLSNV